MEGVLASLRRRKKKEENGNSLTDQRACLVLASWLRLKYPHIVIGALASSAPILYFDDITPQNGYHLVVTKNFRERSESCFNTIKQSWNEIDRVAAQRNGLVHLSNLFSTCSPLNSSEVLKELLEAVYVSSAQYDNPPDNPVNEICSAIDGAPKGTDILGRVAAGLNAIFHGGRQCNYTDDFKPSNKIGWTWQECTEMVMPIGQDGNGTMFEASPFDLNNHTRTCQALFGVTPRPHWITTEFGGHEHIVWIYIVQVQVTRTGWLHREKKRSKSFDFGLQSIMPDLISTKSGYKVG